MGFIRGDIARYLSIRNLRKQPIFVNMASLGLLQIANYVIPIVVIPFVVRALGAEAYGKASYAQNIIAYLTIIVNYGFEYSATQEVAINREDHSKLISIFWTVIKSKLLLLLASFAILGVLYFTFPKVSNDPALYIFAALVNVGFALFPTWFFQGMEKMAKMAALNFAIRVTSGTLTILLITAPEHYRYYLLISSAAYIVVGFIAFLYVIRHYNLSPKDSNTSYKPTAVRKGFPIFLNNILASLYTVSGMTVLGLYASDYHVGIYSGAYRIIMAFIMLTSMPITISLFPNISRKFNESIDKGFAMLFKSIAITSVPAILLCIAVYIVAPYIVGGFLGEEFSEATGVLRILSINPFLVILASFFTVQGMYGLQLQRYAPLVGFIVAAVGLSVNFAFIPSLGAKGAAMSYVISEVTEIIVSALIVFIHYRRLNKNQIKYD